MRVWLPIILDYDGLNFAVAEITYPYIVVNRDWRPTLTYNSDRFERKDNGAW